MCQLSNEDWLMNIENTAAEAEKKYDRSFEMLLKDRGIQK